MIQKVGVVGAGLMGSEIALVFALAGKDVLLSDTSEESLERAKDNLAKILEKGVGRGFYKAEDVQPTLGRLVTTTDLGPMPTATWSSRPYSNRSRQGGSLQEARWHLQTRLHHRQQHFHDLHHRAFFICKGRSAVAISSARISSPRFRA